MTADPLAWPLAVILADNEGEWTSTTAERLARAAREHIAADALKTAEGHVKGENEERTAVCVTCRGRPYWPCQPVQIAQYAARIARGETQ